MKSRSTKRLALALLAGLAGCADPNLMSLYVKCIPAGGAIVEGGRMLATCPGFINYPITPHDRVRRYVETRDLGVEWASGATSSVPQLTLSLTRGNDQELLFERPSGVLGLGADLKAEADLRQAQALQEQINIHRQQLYLQQIEAEERAEERRLRRERGEFVEDDC